jgi:exopolyphosphatase / guanosine-5'-triphosphate,3'-diphosphate pyrophosphatase
MKLAALDLGSNSFHLLVAETHGGDVRKIGSKKDVLRLGAVVQERGALDRAAYDAAFTSVRRLSAFASDLGAEKLLAVATSALRDAHNGRTFCDDCRNRLGIDVELLSGVDEARLAYRGAQSALPRARGRVLVADVGGGSVELAAGEGTSPDDALSLPLGFLRLGRALPLREVGGTARLIRHVQVEAEKVRWQLGRHDTLILSGGTARAIGKLLGSAVAHANARQLVALCERLSAASPAELLELGVEPARATTLAAGAGVVAGLIVGLAPDELAISPRGLREGVLLRELSRRATRAA